MLSFEYWQKTQQLAEVFLQEEAKQLEKVAEKIFQSLQTKGVWHLFGSGHSQLMADEAFHRAGGLVPVNSLTYASVSALAKPSENREKERTAGFAQEIFQGHSIEAGEIFWVISNSGINAISVDVALEAKRRGAEVWAFTSVEHSKKQASRHPEGKKLFEVADAVIDSNVPAGDAALSISSPLGEINYAAASLFLGTICIHSVEEMVVKKFVAAGLTPPVYISANVQGGDEHNKKLEAQYRTRIPKLND